MSDMDYNIFDAKKPDLEILDQKCYDAEKNRLSGSWEDAIQDLAAVDAKKFNNPSGTMELVELICPFAKWSNCDFGLVDSLEGAEHLLGAVLAHCVDAHDVKIKELEPQEEGNDHE